MDIKRLHLFTLTQATIVCTCLLSPNIFAQGGGLQDEAKIDATTGNFSGPLDPGDDLMAAVAGIGDRDGDGVPDMVATVPGDDDAGLDQGAIYLLDLTPTGTVKNEIKLVPGLSFPSSLNGSGFGTSIANLGDLDDDGVTDLAVGAIGDFDTIASAGSVWILFMQANGDVKATHRISDQSSGFPGGFPRNSDFGFSVAGLGDLDGDGIEDLAVGSPAREATTGEEQGSVWLLFLRSDGSVRDSAELTLASNGFPGQTPGDTRFGYDLASIGDLNGDGVPDLAIGSPVDPATTIGSGSVWVTFLNSDGSVLASQELGNLVGGIPNVQQGSEFGRALGTPGDLNGDGIDDLLAGSDFTSIGGRIGLVWILFLQADGTTSGQRLIGDIFGGFEGPISQSSRFAESLAGLGDVDGNGEPDILSGAPGEFGGGGGFLLFLSTGDPNANFSADVRTGCDPLDVSFSDLSTGSNLSSWLWDFGDGNTSTLQNPTHTYIFTFPFSFDVSLTVTGSAGASTQTRFDYIKPSTAPTAAFSATPTLGTAPLAVTFTDQTGGATTAWSWDFGDGTTSTLQFPVHTYSAGGTYSVSLNVSCQGGSDVLLQSDLIVVTEATASVQSDNGTGVNPDIFTSSNLPILGTTWNTVVDGTALAAAGLTFVFGYQDPLIPGILLPQGELLVDVGSPFAFLDIAVLVGNVANHGIPIPPDPNLAGFTFSAQAFLNNIAPSGQLTNRLDVVVGT